MNRAVFNRKKGVVYAALFVALAALEAAFWLWALLE